MKRIIKSFFALLMRGWSHICPYSVSQRAKSFRDTLYTMWIRNFLGEVGEDTSFARPLLFQGGGQRRIRIGSHCCIGRHAVLGCWASYGKEVFPYSAIVIGNNCSFGDYCHLSAIQKISIGDGLLTGRFVYIGDNSHGKLTWEEAVIHPSNRPLVSKGEIRIGRNVWMGDKVTVLGGVTIGDNVIIGANSVVTHDIPSNTVAVGIPAKIIKRLDTCQSQD